MSAWILSIVGIIILSILVDLILPSGQTNKFIKSVFGYLIIIVVLTPVFNFFSDKKFSLDELFSSSSVQVQENFVASVHRQFLDKTEKAIVEACEENGIKFVEVGIEASIFESTLEIKKISVNIKNVVIENSSQHRDIRTSITAIILENIKVEKEVIVFYE